MCGFIHSTFTTLPVKVIGLFESNSAETEWCAASGTVRNRTATHPNTALRTMKASYFAELIKILGCLPQFDRAVENAVQVVLVARVFHDDVAFRLDPPRAQIHPVLRVALRIVHGHSVLDRVRVETLERVGQLQLLAVRMPGGVELGVAVETRRLD